MSKKISTSGKGFLHYAIIVAALLLIFLFVKKDNLLVWINAGLTIASQNRQIEKLEKENAALEAEIQNLSSNKDSLETFAREKYFFSEKGEDVYVIE